MDELNATESGLKPEEKLSKKLSQFPGQRHSTKQSSHGRGIAINHHEAFKSLMETMLTMKSEMETQRGMVNRVIQERGKLSTWFSAWATRWWP